MKYIKTDWPESQEFMDKEGVYKCIEDTGSLFVPEDLYDEITYKLQFPKKYENTNLGTIVCYENYAVVNGTEYYYYDEDLIKRGNIALIYKHDDEEWCTSTIKACSTNMPILLEDNSLFIGLNCELIGVRDPNIPF